MNETIGIKGGHQDRIRTLKIKEEILKKIKNLDAKERKKRLEKALNKTKIKSSIRFVPLLLNSEGFFSVNKNEEKPVIIIEEIRSVDRLPDKEEPIEILYIEDLEEEEKEEEFPFEDNYRPNLNNIQNNKIIEEYQNNLKSIRKDIKSLLYEYKVIENNENNISTSKEADELLNKLNTIILKLDKLKSKYNIDKIERYDENYIQVLIEDYINEFNSRKFVKEVKNSELYILVSDKLNELYNKKEELEERIKNKKNKLLITEDELETLKEKYNEFDMFNIRLLEFQNEQDRILKEMQESLKKAITVEEKVEIRLKAMDKQTKKLFNLVGLQLLLPIPNQLKRAITSTALYMYYLKRMIKPELETKRYKIIKVDDFTDTINNSIDSLEEVEKMIKKTSKEMTKIIESFKDEYKEYIGNNIKCDELLDSLEKIEFEIKDKEEEIKNIKKEQVKNLEKNTSKVKTLNNKNISSM